jgi:hypothetical protein
MELPSSEFSTIIAALGGDGEQKVTMKGSFTAPPDNSGEKEAAHEEPLQEETFTEEPEDELDTEEMDVESPEDEQDLLEEVEELVEPDELSDAESEMSPRDTMDSEPDGQDDYTQTETDQLSDDQGEVNERDDSTIPGLGLPVEEEPQMEYERITAELNQPATPKVNLLTNLINWVAKAKREIGPEQMPIFLEVYGISGHLSPELKEAILHLAEITAEQPEVTNTTEVWSQLMLSLHGILTGGDAPLHPLKTSWDEEVNETPVDEAVTQEEEEDSKKDMPLKLKLVFPNGDGKSKEFCLDLSPSMESNG